MRKFREKFLGPFVITEVLSNNNYRINVQQRFPKMTIDVFNAKFLRPHIQRQPQLDSAPPPQPLPDFYEVERLLADRSQRGRKEYLVRWKGFSSADDTWEPVEHLVRTRALRNLVQRYDRAKQRERRPVPSSAQGRRSRRL